MDERTTSQKLSTIIGRKLPEFIQDQHETFVAYVKAYVEWLEQKGQPADAINSLYANRAIDTTSTEFVEYFRREYLETIPAETLADKRLLVKYIKQYYRAKGTEQSIKFLFRILFNETPELYYPTYDLLRASDGKWVQNIAIKTNNAAIDYSALESTIIVGATSGARAVVETISTFNTQVSGIRKEFILNKSSIIGAFVAGEGLKNASGVALGLTVQNSIKEPTITNPGTGYEKGDLFIIKDTTSNHNVLATGKVKTISSTGGILSVKLDTFPLDEHLLIGATVDFTVSGDGNATGTVAYAGMYSYPGVWLNDDSKLSSTKRLQDNYFWQDYSYQIKSSVPIDSYFDLLQKAVHPAGMLAFGEVVSPEISSDQVLSMQLMVSSIISIYEMISYKLAELNLVASELTLLGMSEYFISYFSTYGGISPEDLHGWRNRPINANPYYPGLQNKSPDDLLTPSIPVGWGTYSPGSYIQLV